MPVDKETLKATLREAVGDDNETYAFLEQKLLANDATATQFLSGFMRNKDYTTKTQALANDRRNLDGDKQTLEGQVNQYKELLEAAEQDKAKVLRDLAQQKVSVAQAHARLKHIKETYALSDEDVPPVSFSDLIETRQTGRPVDSSAVDIDAKLAAFKTDMTRYLADKLVPELGGMAQLDIVWADIRDEHRELTGKRLSAKEAQELFTEADKRHRAGRPTSLKALWEEKYDAPNLRQKKHDEELIKGERAKWDAEVQARRSEEAMQGLHPTPGDQQGLRTSQIFNHKFQVKEEGPGGAPKPRETKSAAERSALTGAERAGKRFLERRAAGVPMGAPDERKTTKVA
jgi:outer membrane murein-binding lipoprotein Lpp